MVVQNFTAEELATEEWRPVAGREGRYSVSSLGRVRSEYDPHIPRRGARFLRPTPDRKGYLKTQFSNGSRHNRSTVRVHTMIALAFLGPRPEGLEINHKDGSKPNNRADNLEYITGEENLRHAFAMGLLSLEPLRRQRGENHWKCKLTAEDVTAIQSLHDGGTTLSEIAGRFNITLSYAYKLVHRLARTRG